MQEYLFSYGTLQSEKVQLDLFGRPLNGSPDILKGYRTTSIIINDPRFTEKNSSHQLIAVPAGEQDQIKGTVLEMTMEELLSADAYEPVQYKRIKVKLQSGKEAWIYSDANSI